MLHILRPRIAGPLALIAALIATLALSLFTAGSAHAQEPVLISADPEPGQITITGRASTSVDNDEAVISLTVSAVRDTAMEAIVDVNRDFDNVILAVLETGVQLDDLSTSGFSLRPEYDFTSELGRILIGIRFSNSLLVTVDEIDNTAAVLDAALSSGNDLLTLNNVGFSVADTAAVEDDVRLAAVQNAVDKATAITTLLGLDLGRAIEIREVGFSTPFAVQEAAPISFDSVGTAPAVFGGDQTVTVSISIVFETWPAAGQ